MKKISTLVLALFVTLTLTGCGSSNGGVKIGVIGPLTGEVSMYGVSVKNGAQLAIDEINENGGILGQDAKLIAYDSKGDGTEGVNAYNRLRDEDEITALVGATVSGVSLSIKDLAINDNMPMLTPTATNADVTLNADNIFRACFTDSYQGSVAAVFVNETLEIDKAAVLYNKDDAYSEGLATAFIDEFEARGTVVTVETFGNGDDDYSSLLTKINATDAEVVFLPSYVSEVGAILTQANDLGMTVPFVGGDGWDSVEKDYAAVAEGHYFGSHYAKTDPAEIVQNFVSSYTETFGETPNALASLAYDAVYAMANAIEKAGSTDASDIITALANLDMSEAVTGSIKFDENGDPIKSITMIQIVNGEHVVVDKVESGN